MLELLVAFALGALLSSVVLGILGALHQVLADHVLAKIGVVVAWLWAKFTGIIGVFRPARQAQGEPAAKTAGPTTTGG